jgi:hypothetical protein
MKRFLIKLALFLVILIALDRVLNLGLQSVRPVDYKYFIDAKKEFFENDIYYDIWLLGDSHIADAVDPRCLEKFSGLTSFNLGIYHSTPYENYFTLLAALKHKSQKPKAIILGTNPEMFFKPAIPGEYTPLIINDLTLRWKLMLHSSDPVEMSYFFKSVKEKYLFNSLFKKIAGQKYVPTREVHETFNGYLETHNQSKGVNWNNSANNLNYDSVNRIQLDYFRREIDLARENGIKVYVVNPPVWREKLKTSQDSLVYNGFLSAIGDLEKEYSLPVFNSNFTILQNELVKGDFLNVDHLNYFGATKFSTELSRWIGADNLVKTSSSN